MKKGLSLFLVITLLLAILGCNTQQNEGASSIVFSEPSPNTATELDVLEPTGLHPSIDEYVTEEQTLPVSQSSFEVHYIDVGQADAALVLCDDQAILIDGGNTEDSNLIYTYLKKHSVNHLDYIVCTHAHEDHVGGLSGALNYASVDTVFCSVTTYDSKAFSNFTKNLDKQGVAITVPQPGDSFALGSASITILGPIHPNEEPNNTSIVLRIVYGSTSFLFTGDAEVEEENDILEAGHILQSTVLKVGHHGSDTSTSYRWLREVAPEYAIISVGLDNSYGHPTENTLSKLRDAEVTVFRTDIQGDVICTSDGTNVSFQVSRNASVDTLSGADTGGKDICSPSLTESAEASEATTYVLNTQSKKFHLSNCSSVGQMSTTNQMEVSSSHKEIIAAGYDPCKRCNP